MAGVELQPARDIVALADGSVGGIDLEQAEAIASDLVGVGDGRIEESCAEARGAANGIDGKVFEQPEVAARRHEHCSEPHDLATDLGDKEAVALVGDVAAQDIRRLLLGRLDGRGINRYHGSKAPVIPRIEQRDCHGHAMWRQDNERPRI